MASSWPTCRGSFVLLPRTNPLPHCPWAGGIPKRLRSWGRGSPTPSFVWQVLHGGLWTLTCNRRTPPEWQRRTDNRSGNRVRKIVSCSFLPAFHCLISLMNLLLGSWFARCPALPASLLSWQQRQKIFPKQPQTQSQFFFRVSFKKTADKEFYKVKNLSFFLLLVGGFGSQSFRIWCIVRVKGKERT